VSESILGPIHAIPAITEAKLIHLGWATGPELGSNEHPGQYLFDAPK
jgi:hypothetical protein